MASSPEWRDDSDVTIGAALSYSGLAAGASAEETVRLYNDFDGSDGADPIYRGLLFARAKYSPDDQYLSYGLPVLDQRMVQVKVVAGMGGLAVVPTGWIDVGTDAFFQALPQQINSTEGVELDIRVFIPSSETQVDDTDVEIRLNDDRTIALPTGLWEAGGSGILAGIRDDQRPAFFYEPVTITAIPDDTVTISDAQWSDIDGIPHVELGHSETITKADKNASDIAGTEGYYITVSYGTGATVTLTKGAKAATIGAAVKEDVPTSEKLWGWIAVTLNGAVVEINSGDIDQHVNAYPETAAHVSTSGLNRTYSGWRALVGNRLVRETPTQVVALDDDTADLFTWIRPGGTMEAGTTSPEARSLAVEQITTAAGAVTVANDRRVYLDHLDEVVSIGGPRTITTAGVIELGAAMHPGNRILYLRPSPGALIAALFDTDPSALSYSSGSWDFDLQVLRSGTWTTLFTTGPGTRAPTIEWDATSNEDRAALAEVLDWRPGEILRARIDPTGLGGAGTPASGALVTMRWR